MLNKPLGVSLGAALSDDAKSTVGDALASLPLFKGGDVSEGQLVMLHEFADLEDSTYVRDGLYFSGNVSAVRRAIENRAALVEQQAAEGGPMRSAAAGVASGGPPSPRAPRVKCVAGFAGWARQQHVAPGSNPRPCAFAPAASAAAPCPAQP